MATYYEQLQEVINKNRKELERLLLEKIGLHKTRSAWSESNFLKEENLINKRIDEIKNIINKNQEIISSYDLLNNYIINLKNLIELYNSTYDLGFKETIAKEIRKRRELVTKKLDESLPEDLKRTIRNEYFSIKDNTKEMSSLAKDSKMLELTNKRNRQNSYLNKARQEVELHLNNMKNIFEEERRIRETEGPFSTEKELDDFIDKYMLKKVEENKLLEAAKKRVRAIEKNINTLDRQIDERTILIEEATNANVDVKEYENILNKINKRDELDKYLIELGYKELVENKNKIVKPTKEETEKYKEKIKQHLIEKTKSKKESLSNEMSLVVQKEKSLVPQNEKSLVPSHNILPFNKEIKELTTEEIDKGIEKYLDEVEISNQNNESPKKVSEYSYKTIISKLVYGLEPKKKDGKHYRFANLQIRDNFKKELNSGNYLYNIVHVVPAIIKLPIELIKKVSTKITYSREARERMKVIKNRLDALSEKDLMILFKEYSNHIEQEKYTSGINILIDERLTRFVDEKVHKINKDLELKYNDVFNCIKQLEAIDYEIRKKDISENARKSYIAYRKQLLNGRASEIASIRKDYEEAKTLLSGGMHGFSENVKATESKMNYVGFRFSKDHDLDVELLEKEAKLEQAERVAINTNNDEMALRVFTEAEKLLAKNTKIENSIFGKRSTGKKYYSPLAEKLDYRNDPFIRDIFTTVAVVGATLTSINALEKNKAIEEKQLEIDKVNEKNTKTMESVNNYGRIVSNKKQTLEDGIKAESYQDSLNISNVLERNALDKSSEVHGGWSVGTEAYRNFRTIAQNTYNDFYTSTSSAITDITTKYASGEISQIEAINLLQEVSSTSQKTLSQVVNESLPHLVNYANNHSQFDLSGVEDAMSFIAQHPTAITDMNKAFIDTIDLVEDLATLSIEQVTALSTIPNEIQKTLLGAAGATALAMKVSEKVETKAKKGKYGNKVTEMLNNLIEKENNNTNRR